MTDQEIKFFDNFFKPHMWVFEWGSGGSSLWWSPQVARWNSVEHDKDWFEILEQHTIPRNCKIHFMPLDREQEYINFPQYYLEFNKINIFIIDGRLRLKCREMLTKNMRPGQLLFVHDSIRQSPSEEFDWYIDIIEGLKKGNHKGVRMYGRFQV